MASAQPIAAPALPAVHRYFEVALYLLVATSVLTLATTGKLDPVSTIVPVALLAVKGWRWRQGRSPELSHGAATVLVAAYLLFFPVDLWVVSRAMAEGAPNPILYAALLSTIHLMLFVMMVRLFSARSTRDHLFLAATAFAAMLVAATLTVDTLYLAFFLLFLVLAVATFVALEVRRAAEGAATPPMAAGTGSARRLHKALSLTAVALAGGSLVLGVVIFYLLPRVTAGYMSGLNLQPSLITGFSDDVELGQIGRIKRNEAVVMRVRVEGGPAELGNSYFRGIALTSFDGRRWYQETREPQVILGNHENVFYLTPAMHRWRAPGGVNYRRVSYTVLLEPIGSNTIFVIGDARRLQGRFSPELERVGRRLRRTYLLQDVTGSVSNPQYNYSKILYHGESLVSAYTPEQLRAASGPYPAGILETYLQLPALDPRIAQLARQVTSGAASAYDQARAIEQHLRRQFGYTLDLPAPREDPLAEFLFEWRRGHCEYFASAMTVMLRTRGIPARLVNGFLPGEYNDVGQDFIVRGADAHSWVEVYLPGYGWTVFDPTPPAADRQRGFIGRLAFYWDWFELMWSEWVINYDLRHQRTLLTGLLEGSRRWSLRSRDYFRARRRGAVDALKQWQAYLAESRWAVPAGVALAILLLVVMRRRALLDYLAAYWGLQLGRGGQPALLRATLHYQQMLRLLERRGLRKAPAQTPLEFAASIAAPELAAPVGEMTALYQDARFGHRPASAGQMAVLLARIRDTLRPR